MWLQTLSMEHKWSVLVCDQLKLAVEQCQTGCLWRWPLETSAATINKMHYWPLSSSEYWRGRGGSPVHPLDLYMEACIRSENQYWKTDMGVAVGASNQRVSYELDPHIREFLHATGVAVLTMTYSTVSSMQTVAAASSIQSKSSNLSINIKKQLLSWGSLW